MAKKIRRQQALTYRLRPDEKNLHHYIDVPCSPARKAVQITRAQADIMSARRGTTVACMNANCATREKHAFPHPVFLAVFTRTSAYVIDKLTKGGVPAHCVWYKHSNSEEIGIHDKIGPTALVDMGLAEKTIRLNVPKIRLGQTGGGAPGIKNAGRPGPRKAALPTGARRRALESGVNFPSMLTTTE